ncbi:MAG TPA: F0F1 ATP synthase subunit B [Patescibacteria group bacterium]|nr:F0F1 ATP synthase subunit B [Patescibacteria group bacterium]
MLIHIINIAQAAEEASHAAGSQSLTEVLGIDWKLFVAQLINFGLVLFVLWRWVYKPLVKILNERTKKIEKSLKEAQEIGRRLDETKEEQENILAEARKEAAVILDQAEKGAVENKNKMVEEAEAHINKQLEVARQKLSEEKEKISREIKVEVADMVEAALVKIIPEHLDSKADKKIIKQTLEKDES